MCGYPQISFWISIAFAKICFPHIVINQTLTLLASNKISQVPLKRTRHSKHAFKNKYDIFAVLLSNFPLKPKRKNRILCMGILHFWNPARFLQNLIRWLFPLILESQQRSHTLWDVYKIVNDPMGLCEELNFCRGCPSNSHLLNNHIQMYSCI